MLVGTMIKRAATVSRNEFLSKNPTLRDIAQYNRGAKQKVTRKQYVAIRDAQVYTRAEHIKASWFGVHPSKLYDIAFNKTVSKSQRV